MGGTEEPVASFRGVTKCYGATPALRGLNLEVRRGEVLALLGENGAGKTTAMQLLLGLRERDEGELQLFGQDPRDRSARTRVGAMLQVAQLPGALRVGEHVELFSSYWPRSLAKEETLRLAGIEHLAKRRTDALSGGEQRRLLFALAICGDPDLLLLDEPTVGLDVQARRTFWQRIAALSAAGKTILVTTHYLEEAEAVSTRIALLKEGVVAAEGTPAQLRARFGGNLTDAYLQIAGDRAEVRS